MIDLVHHHDRACLKLNSPNRHQHVYGEVGQLLCQRRLVKIKIDPYLDNPGVGARCRIEFQNIIFENHVADASHTAPNCM